MLALMHTGLVPAAEGDLEQVDAGAVLNVVHSEELRIVMRRLDNLAYDRERTALELQRLQLHQIEDLVETAGELLERSERLPEILPAASMSAADRITFHALAAELYRQTLRINTSITGGDREAIWQGYEQLRETCNACHQLFRMD